jgi:hypothetical protein
MKPHNRQPSKIRPVPISQMRVPSPGVSQREFSQGHADQIAAEMDLNKIGILTVNIRDGHALVLDGQHRLAALKQWDPSIEGSSIDCEVFENLTDAQMAEMFLGRNRRKQVAPFDHFRVSLTAERKRERDIERAVLSNGQTISRDRDEGISCVGAIGKVYDRAGATVLGQVIRTINLGFGGDPLAFDRSIIEGLGLVYNRFNGKTNEKNLAHRLSDLRHGARELLRKAEAIRERTGNQKKHCVAAVIVDIYNKGEGATTSKGRLPSWWKETTTV